jgi:recombination associated protein RdgC
MFKSISIFNIAPGWAETADLATLELALSTRRFEDCSPSQEKAVGWVEPRGEAHGAMVESIGGQWLMRLMVQTKLLPGAVVKDELAKRVAQAQESTGRKPGKKQTREMKEELRIELLAKAFTKKTSILVWIDRKEARLVIESTSKTRTDEVITLLVGLLDGFSVLPVQTRLTPASAMAAWLNSGEMPAGFSADRDCVLRASDESKASVRYAKHPLDIAEIKGHIVSGKVPSQLAVTWNGLVSFQLAESGNLRRIEFLDGVYEGRADSGESDFDADMAIGTGTLARMLPDLMEALGGAEPLAAAH